MKHSYHMMFLIFALCIMRGPTVTNAVCTGDVDITSDDDIETALAIEVACDESSMTASINPCVLEQMGYDPEEDITVNGKQDFYTGTKCDNVNPAYTSQTSWSFTLPAPFEDCGTKKYITGEKYMYTNWIRSIQLSSTDVIARRKNINLQFSCIFDRVFENSGSGSGSGSGDDIFVDPNVLTAEVGEVSGSGAFGSSVDLCEDMDCVTKINNGETVNVLDVVYLVVESIGDFTVQIMKVTATTTANHSPGDLSYDLVTDGCENEDDEEYSTLTNAQSGSSHLKFHLFQWTSDHEADVYLQVQYRFCDPDLESCEISCSKRRRRSARPSSDSDQVFTATIGPFKTRVN